LALLGVWTFLVGCTPPPPPPGAQKLHHSDDGEYDGWLFKWLTGSKARKPSTDDTAAAQSTDTTNTAVAHASAPNGVPPPGVYSNAAPPPQYPGYPPASPAFPPANPSYGQPNPSYGQPSPGYGQPAPGYGQPNAPAYQNIPPNGSVSPGYYPATADPH